MTGPAVHSRRTASRIGSIFGRSAAMAATSLTQQEVSLTASRYPQLPGDYVSHLTVYGWGDTESGKVLYDGPLEAADIFGAVGGPRGLLVLGDDLARYCLAYDPGAGVYGD